MQGILICMTSDLTMMYMYVYAVTSDHGFALYTSPVIVAVGGQVKTSVLSVKLARVLKTVSIMSHTKVAVQHYAQFM